MSDNTEKKLALFGNVHMIYKPGVLTGSIPVFLHVITHAGFIRITHWSGVSIFISSDPSGRDQTAGSHTERDLRHMILQLSEKFCKSEGEVRIKTWDAADGIFLELLQAAKDEDLIMARIKTMELLLKLKDVPTDTALVLPVHSGCTPREAVVAKSAYSYMMRYIEKRVTVKELSEAFRISQTQIKCSFKKYFGQAIFTYMRREKMNAAAYMLKNSKSSIQDIAKRCGYSSAGKFAKAFAREMDTSPREYRKNL